MCLAIPGRVLAIASEADLRLATIDYGGITREASLAYLPEAQIGDFVLVHAGFAITQLDEAEAERTLALLREIGECVPPDEEPPA